MLVPLEWLKDYTDINAGTDEFCEKMIMSGSNIETAESFGKNTENVVVGRVIKKEKHPDADKLSVCKVDTGAEEPLQIVCGASNVFEGALVPVALHKSRIPGPLHGQPRQEGGVKITKGKLRGVESMGMICSAGELGFDDKVVPVFHKDGIWILPEDLVPGTDITEALGLKSTVVDFEITPNRPDCLSMLGMARESAATFGKMLRYPNTQCRSESRRKAEDFIEVQIKDPELCRRYSARIVTDIKTGQSPWWLQKRLMYAGMRPINNIVDITNFVMLEYGQPIHAFDIRNIEGGRIVVETAASGERFTTLDGAERTLDDKMLLIKDGKKGVAIAGVMGGLNSEIQEDTETILIESANFDADSIRTTSKRLGLRTEASSRFEKGVDPDLCDRAADRVCRLIEMLGAGIVAEGIADVYPEPQKPWTVDVRTARIARVLGVGIDNRTLADMFRTLEMEVEDKGDILRVTPPTVRRDLRAEVDFIEEAARMYGYDRLPVTIPKGSHAAEVSRDEQLRKLARDTLCALGANEIQTYSFVSPRGVDNIGIEEDSWERNFVVLKNPLGEENSVMRTILLPNMLEVLSRNYSRNIEEAKCFEIGSTFGRNLADPEDLPEEQDALSIGLYGETADFFMLKGMIEELMANMGIKNVMFTAESGYKAFHPGRCARISVGDEELGIMGEIHPDAADKYGLDTRCYCAEFMFGAVMRNADTQKAYRPLPKYPAVTRDIALITAEEVTAGDLTKTISETAGDILEKVELFDVYRGEQVAEGMKSSAFTLTYRDPERTLTDQDVLKIHDRILEELGNRFNAVLREM